MTTDLEAGVVRDEDEVRSMAGREQVGFECTDCGHRVRSIGDGRNCPECENIVWDRVVTSQSVGLVRELLGRFDWGCIWCERFFTDDEVIHDHDYAFSEPVCPNCPQRPEIASADVALLVGFLPDPDEVAADGEDGESA